MYLASTILVKRDFATNEKSNKILQVFIFQSSELNGKKKNDKHVLIKVPELSF